LAFSKRKTLKDLAKEVPSEEELFARLTSLTGTEDYQAAMLASSLLEYMLEIAISMRMISMGKVLRDQMFSDSSNGPLCTFSAKTKLAYVLAIFGPTTRAQIDIVRVVRNHFAHYKNISGFDHDEVVNACGKLRRPIQMKEAQLEEGAFTSPKFVYVTTCIFTCFGLSLDIKKRSGLGRAAVLFDPPEFF
jgi:hypothetical protein